MRRGIVLGNEVRSGLMSYGVRVCWANDRRTEMDRGDVMWIARDRGCRNRIRRVRKWGYTRSGRRGAYHLLYAEILTVLSQELIIEKSKSEMRVVY